MLTFQPPVVADGSRGEESHQDNRARGSGGFVVYRSEFLTTRTEPTKNGSVSGSPEGLSVGKEGINARHQGRTPQIDRRPPIRQKFRRGGEG